MCEYADVQMCGWPKSQAKAINIICTSVICISAHQSVYHTNFTILRLMQNSKFQFRNNIMCKCADMQMCKWLKSQAKAINIICTSVICTSAH
jgi:hypothetical protein